MNEFSSLNGFDVKDKTARNNIENINDNVNSINTKLFNQNIINVKDYGVIGDGETDDTSALQSIIDNLSDNDILYFPKGNYKITPTSTYHISGYGNYDPYYGVIIENKDNITIICEGTILPDFSQHFMNTIVIKSCSNINIKGFKATYSGEKLNTSVTQMKSLFTVNDSTNINIEKCYGENVGGLALVVASTDINIFNCKSIRTDKDYKSPSFYGAYNSKSVTFDGCICYGGTDDGDITLFGSSTAESKVINCYLDARLENGTLEVNSLQGICVDSGCKNCIVDNNIVKFYYYGIDVKTACESITVNANQCVSNKYGIASRLGEGNDKTINTVISNNIINPKEGNGNTVVIYDEIDTCGIYSQNSYGVTIDGNTISCSTNASHNYIPIYVTSNLMWNDTYKQPTNIINNVINNNIGIGANFRNNNYSAIVINGYADGKSIYDVNCSNNIIKGSQTGGLTKYMIEGQYITHSKFNNNQFTNVPTSSGGMKFSNLSNSIISNNKFNTSRINLEITDGNRLLINNNFFKNSEEYYNTVKVATTSNIIMQNNLYSSAGNESVPFILTSCTNGNVSNNTFITTLNSGISDSTSSGITKENNVIITRS